MSVKALSIVWEGYPGGGSELLTALALADWSNDIGESHDQTGVAAVAQDG